MILHMKCCHYAFYNFLIIISVSLQIAIQEFYMRNPLIEGKFFAQNRCLHEKIRFLWAVFEFYTLQVIIAQQKRYWRNILTFFSWVVFNMTAGGSNSL